ncbi:MAG: hypothetical protein JXB38_19600 [Anaerolineales bacterium]|nr:hypothetical protein [Anaerolineales bacterium]
MNSLSDYFDALKSNIEPKPERVDIAKNFHIKIREFLEKHDGIATVKPQSRLVGSYARSTAIKNIKDVDFILIIDPSYKHEDTKTVLDCLYNTLEDFPKFLEDSGSIRDDLRHQRRSVNIEFIDYDFNLDVVPVIMENEINDVLLIPDKDWNEWVNTQPVGYNEALSELNQKNGGKIVPLIKMLKHWRDVHMIYMRPKSYWLECMVFNFIDQGIITTEGNGYAVLFRDILATINSKYSPYLEKDDKVPEISDPMLKHNVAFNWERSDFETFMRRIKESYKWANNALEEHREESEAIELWQKVFNTDEEEWFQSYLYDKIGASLGQAISAGTAGVDRKTGRLTPDRSNQTTRDYPTHNFYGEDHENKR